MNKKWMAAMAVAINTVIVAGVANAQEKDEVQDRNDKATKLAPVKNALELTVASGYAQGFGDVGSNRPSLGDAAKAGGALQLGVGYRLIPQLTLGAYGTGSIYERGGQVSDAAKLYSATAGVQADWHFLPGGHQFDPFVTLGTGWRGFWIKEDQGTTSLQGLEIAKLQLGVDYRMDRAIAISPLIGVDLSTFLSQDTSSSDSFHKIDSPKVDSFIFAGLQGRFDIPTGGRTSQMASR
jgi:outer membrane protein W